MKNIIMVSLLMLSLVAITACGETRGDRALSGAGIGAGIGAATGAVTGGNLATGAIVGGAVGAAAGGLTNKDQINLDRH